MKRTALPLVLLLALAVAPIAFAQNASVKADKAKLDSAQKVYKASKATLAKKPKNAVLKKKCGAATAAYGTAMMTTLTLPPREKYVGALHLYREALTYDPKNEEALKNKKLIEDIYKSMGRPIPK